MFIDALYGDLALEEKASLEKHLKECAFCSEEFEKMTDTMETMSQRVRPEPEEAFFDGYWNRLQERMSKERVVRTAKDKWWKSLFAGKTGRIPRWSFQAAASILLVVVGIFLGRTFFRPDQITNQPPMVAQNQAQPDSQINVTQRAFDYIQRSKLILLAISNFDPENQDPYTLDLPYQQHVSRTLVEEAGWLKEELTDRHHRRLQELVSDLEVILLQIANLEGESDISAIELVQDGVKSRGILFKIHLAQFKDSSMGHSEADRVRNKSQSF